MNLVVASVLAGLAALATSLLLENVAPTPTPAPRSAAVLAPSVFLAGASVMVAADGTCHTATDAGMPLLGAGAPLTGAPPRSSVAADEGAPAELINEVGEETVAVDPPPGGSCGGHLGEAIADAAPPPVIPKTLPAREPEVARSEPAAASAEVPRPAAKPRPRRAKPPAEALTAWWPARKADALNVLFVGEAAFGSAISILTDGTFDNADSANAHIEVKDAAGRRMSRRWQLATNRKMLLLPVEAGVYTVSIRSELADAQSRQTATASSGVVYVR